MCSSKSCLLLHLRFHGACERVLVIAPGRMTGKLPGLSQGACGRDTSCCKQRGGRSVSSSVSYSSLIARCVRSRKGENGVGHAAQD